MSIKYSRFINECSTSLDIDECAVLNGGCNQICINKPGTFRCTCIPGYQLSHNRRTCEGCVFCANVVIFHCNHLLKTYSQKGHGIMLILIQF